MIKLFFLEVQQILHRSTRNWETGMEYTKGNINPHGKVKCIQIHAWGHLYSEYSRTSSYNSEVYCSTITQSAVHQIEPKIFSLIQFN